MLTSQKYSDIVFKNIAEEIWPDGDVSKRYKSLCKRSGGIFRTVGLVQFVTFIEAKGKKEPHYAILAKHLQKELKQISLIDSNSRDDYLGKIRQLLLPNFMQVSHSMLLLLQWHKRIGEILIEGEAVDQDEKE